MHLNGFGWRSRIDFRRTDVAGSLGGLASLLEAATLTLFSRYTLSHRNGRHTQFATVVSVLRVTRRTGVFGLSAASMI